MDQTSSILNVPPEILYDILAEVFSAYIDYAITLPPPHELRRIKRIQLRLSQGRTDQAGADSSEDDMLDLPGLSLSEPQLPVWDAREAAEPLPENQLTPLLLVCHRFREIATQLFQDALGYRCGQEK